MSFYGQNDTISVVKTSNSSVVSADKMNVVYRGLPNPISIAVPNCKSFTATAQGLSKVSEGKYILIPGSGIETIIILEIILNDGSSIKEEHKFRIKNIPLLYGKINGLNCNKSILLMTKKELIGAELSIGFPNDFAYDLSFEIKQFTVSIKDKKLIIEGDKFTNEVVDLINKLPINSRFTITDFKSNIDCFSCNLKTFKSIEIMIVKNDEFDK